MTEPVGLAGILLAAGAGSRFGGPKQAAQIGGASLAARAARLALSCCPAGVVAVTGAHAEQVEACLLGMPVRLARNAGWAAGLASSIRCGLDALPAGAAACLVMLCDQPDVDEQDLQRLTGAWVAAPQLAAAARYGGTTGVPAIFPARYWPGLRALRGDQGARVLIASLPDISAVDMPHAARDVDTPGDLPPG